MRRKVAFLLVLLGIAGLIIGIVKLLSSRSLKQGVIKINSTPLASIFLDNKHLGRTPFEDKVVSGDYTLKIVPDQGLANLASWQGKITVRPNILTYVNRDLSESELTSAGEVLWLEKIASKMSEISVTTIPDGATASLDETPSGTTPVTLPNISAGDHVLTLVSPGFLSRILKIKTTGGYRLTAFVQLALSTQVVPTPTPEASPTATLTILRSGPKLTPTKAATASATRLDPAKPFILIKDTPTGYLNVRQEPGGSKIGQVNPGEKYTIVDSKISGSTTWYQIEYEGANLGWVSGQYAEKIE